MTTEKTKPQDVPLPEPSLVGLASGLAAQAMASMGMFSGPSGEQIEIKLNQAKHLIETIAILEEKTKGNRTEDETNKLGGILHELRMIFVAAQNEHERRTKE
ncbi:MAG: DUF1844 domain-containing protein [Planctomycetaceae bacterium]|jgi:hypothetical protein|nr:DUF1844 domain-containing protein [Planctomycetaceae bacterium]